MSNKNGSTTVLPKWSVKLALRVAQLTDKPGQYQFTLIVLPDGTRQLIPPAQPEKLDTG